MFVLLASGDPVSGPCCLVLAVFPASGDLVSGPCCLVLAVFLQTFLSQPKGCNIILCVPHERIYLC